MGNIYDHEVFFAEYAKMDRSRLGLDGAGEWHQLKKLLPSFEGADVLDIGCGYGWHCKYAAEHGAASVVGIDQSLRMISEAELRNGDERIEYRVCDLEDFAWPSERFDCVISNLVLHYVQDLTAVYKNVYHVLKPGGCFVFNIEHPTFTAGVDQTWICDEKGRTLYWPVDDYYYPGERETIFLGQKVKKYHHTLTQILGGLLAAGFCIEAVEEAEPSPEALMHVPGMTDEMRRPMMLLVRAGK